MAKAPRTDATHEVVHRQIRAQVMRQTSVGPPHQLLLQNLCLPVNHALLRFPFGSCEESLVLLCSGS